MSVEKKGLPVFLQMTHRTVADIRLRHRPHLHGSLHPDLYALLLQHVGHGQSVDGGGQHAHVVGADAHHPVAAVLQAAPEVAAAHHDAHLDAQLDTALDHVAHFADHIKVQPPGRLPRQGLAADFQQYSFILRILHGNPSLRNGFKTLFLILI